MSKTVLLQTSMGDIEIELNDSKAPKTVENFINYVEKGHYDNTIFHRVINGFMVQGGGFDADMNQKPTDDPIPNEANNGLKNETGALAMARTSDPNSATAQFFINVADNHFLDHTAETPQGWGYAVFGKVSKGMAVVNRIKEVATTSHGMHRDVPAEPIVIEKAEVVTED